MIDPELRTHSPDSSWKESRDWVMADPDMERQLSIVSPLLDRQRWLKWDSISPEVIPCITALRLRVSPTKPDLDRIPESVASLSNLEYLSMPVRFARKLNDLSLPPSLRVLAFDEPGGTSGAVPSNVSFPQVRSIFSVAVPLTFTIGNFPNLRRVNLKFKSNTQMMRELPKEGYRVSHCGVDVVNYQQFNKLERCQAHN